MARAAKPEARPVAQEAIEFDDNQRLAVLVGAHDRNLARLEQKLDVRIARRGNRLTAHGEPETVARATAALRALWAKLDLVDDLTQGDVDAAARMAREGDASLANGVIRAPRRAIVARGPRRPPISRR